MKYGNQRNLITKKLSRLSKIDLDLITLKKNKYYRTFKVNLEVFYFILIAIGGLLSVFFIIFLWISLDFRILFVIFVM